MADEMKTIKTNQTGNQLTKPVLHQSDDGLQVSKVNQRGGKRPGAGRKKGAMTQKTREIADRAIEEGIAQTVNAVQINGDRPDCEP